MQKNIFLVISLLFLSFENISISDRWESRAEGVNSKPKLVRMKVAEGISVALPKDWHPMDDLDFNERYPSVRAPLAAYTNEDRLADFSLNISATQWPDSDVEIARQFFRASILNTFDKVDLLDEGIREVKGKKLIYFEFESYVKGDSRKEGFKSPVWDYSYLTYLIEPGRSLVFSFHCPRRQRNEWQETARAIMDSIKVK